MVSLISFILQKDAQVFKTRIVALGTRSSEKTRVNVVEIPSGASFQEVLRLCSDHFNVSDAKFIRVGQLKTEAIDNFDGLMYFAYLKANGMYPSQVTLYVETKEKFEGKDHSKSVGSEPEAVGSLETSMKRKEPPATEESVKKSNCPRLNH